MPFTISHAAAAIPFQRTRLVMSALILGCMAPDFEYFLHVRIAARVSHSIPGAFEFVLPVSLIFLAVFHGLLKRPVVALLPDAVQRRIVFREFRFLPFTRLLWICLSLLVGIATHLLWDSFTHPGMWFVENFDWFYQNTRVPVINHTWANYKYVQYVSTVAGLALLGIWFLHWYVTAEPTQEPRLHLRPWTRVAILGVILAVAAVLAFFRAESLVGNEYLTGGFAANAVVAFVSFSLLQLLIFSIIMHKRVSSASLS